MVLPKDEKIQDKKINDPINEESVKSSDTLYKISPRTILSDSELKDEQKNESKIEQEDESKIEQENEQKNEEQINKEQFITPLHKTHTHLKSLISNQDPNFHLNISLKYLDYFKKPTINNKNFKFFTDGYLNACYECIDRHLGDDEAFLFDCTDDPDYILSKESGSIDSKKIKNRYYFNNHKIQIKNDLYSISYTYTQSLLFINHIATAIYKLLKDKYDLAYFNEEEFSFENVGQIDTKKYEKVLGKYLSKGIIEKENEEFDSDELKEYFKGDTENQKNNKNSTKNITACIYMPMCPYTIFTALALARLNLTHTVVFGAFSTKSLKERIIDSDSKILITVVKSKRAKQVLDFYGRVGDVLDVVDDVLVCDEERDYADVVKYEKENEKQEGFNIEKENKKSKITFLSSFTEPTFLIPPRISTPDHPLFILYTSGSTGKPKGLVHSTAGYLTSAAFSTQEVFFDYVEKEMIYNDIQESNERSDLQFHKDLLNQKEYLMNQKEDLHNQSDDLLTKYKSYFYKKHIPTPNTFFCTADLGWITGHTYVLYGPSLLKKRSIILMGLPTYPFHDRLLRMVDVYDVVCFYTAPTLIRCLKKLIESKEEEKNEESKKNNDKYILPALRHTKNTKSNSSEYTFQSLKILGSVGEPLNTPSYIFYKNLFNNKPVVDCYWQTETGSIVVFNRCGSDYEIGECCGRGIYGLDVLVLRKESHDFLSFAEEGELGLIAFKNKWPSMTRTILNDYTRFKQTYLTPNDFYLTGDEGYYKFINNQKSIFIRGRADDVINVSGHRISTCEIESAVNGLNEEGFKVIESAMVGIENEITGMGIVIFAVVVQNDKTKNEFKSAIKLHLRKTIGALINPDRILLVPDLPKTRTGKIMRRVLRQLLVGKDVGDISTIGNEECVGVIKEIVENE